MRTWSAKYFWNQAWPVKRDGKKFSGCCCNWLKSDTLPPAMSGVKDSWGDDGSGVVFDGVFNGCRLPDLINVRGRPPGPWTKNSDSSVLTTLTFSSAPVTEISPSNDVDVFNSQKTPSLPTQFVNFLIISTHHTDTHRLTGYIPGERWLVNCPFYLSFSICFEPAHPLSTTKTLHIPSWHYSISQWSPFL